MGQIVRLLAIVVILTAVSCERAKSTGRELIHQTKEKSADLADRVAPRFDAYEPDTKYNRKRFDDFIKVERTPDVKNIYCFDDAIGIDADYQFSFNCNEITAKRIIEKHQLKPDKSTTDYAFGLQNDFKWWDKKKIEKLELYSWYDGDQYYKYFWYDTAGQKAYFFDFDM